MYELKKLELKPNPLKEFATLIISIIGLAIGLPIVGYIFNLIP